MHKSYKYLKISKAVGISIICFSIVVSIICFKLLFPSPISKYNMEKEFFKSKEILTSIAQYLEKQKYISIYITSTDKRGELFVYNNNEEMGEYIQITEDLIIQNITDLFLKYKYSVITKEENGIYFQRWSNRDYGRGVVYSIDGKQPKNERITKLESLSEENWYFYEEK